MRCIEVQRDNKDVYSEHPIITSTTAFHYTSEVYEKENYLKGCLCLWLPVPGCLFMVCLNNFLY